MGNDLLVGLQLSGIGLGVTFIALGLLIGVMVLLVRIFPAKVKHAEVKDEAETLPKEDENRLEEMAVAMAVGICLLERDGAMEQRDPNLGRLLEQ